MGEKSSDGVNGEDDPGNGVAPNAKLAVCDIGSGGAGMNPSPDMKYLLQPGRIANSHIHTASWGAGSNLGGYTYYCTRFDEYLYLNQDFLVTMAAGNSGAWGISWPATAKNIVAVGATSNSLDSKLDLASFSSRGQVAGNRIKPDLVAPGAALQSAYAGTSCSTLGMQGTSMATPAVAGVSAIVRQYLIEKGIKPSGSLIKSLLANSGIEIDYGKAFDGSQGFGLVDILQTLPLKNYNEFTLLGQNLETLSEGGTNTIEVTIDSYSGTCNVPLSVTMVYTDPPGESILNDIDLEVQGGGKTHHPNGLNEADRFNVIERIRINDVQDGETYTIRIIGANLIQSEILYSLSVTGCFVSGDVSGNTFLIGPRPGSGTTEENVESVEVPEEDNSEAQESVQQTTQDNVRTKQDKEDKNTSGEKKAIEIQYSDNSAATDNVPASQPADKGKTKDSKEKSHH